MRSWAACVPYEGDFWDFYCGKARIEKALPVGTVLTIAAAGSEGSGDTVVTQESTMLKRGAGSIAHTGIAFQNNEVPSCAHRNN